MMRKRAHERFSEDIDRLLRGDRPAHDSADSEYEALLTTADLLARELRPLGRARPGFESQLEARLAGQLSVANRPWWQHVPLCGGPVLHWRLGPAVAMVLALLLIAGAGVAAATKGGLVWQLIEGAPPPVVPVVQPPADKMIVQPSYVEMRPEEASREAGFRVRLPETLPAGVDPDDVTVTVSRAIDTGHPLVRVAYWKAEVGRTGDTRSWSMMVVVDLNQLPVQDEPWFRPTRWIDVTGEPLGVVCEQETLPLRPGVEALRFKCDGGRSFLTWVEDGIEFQLWEAGLTPEQAVEIARSVR